MKRFSNVIFYIVATIIIIHTFYNRFGGEEYSWMKQIFLISTVICLCAYVLNVVDRYSAIFIFTGAKNKFNFGFNSALGESYLSWGRLSFYTSIGFGIFFGSVLLYMTKESFYPGLLFLIAGLEKGFYYIYSKMKKYFRVGINKNALILNNGGMKIIPFSGLRSIEIKYDEILFIYSKEKVDFVFCELTVPENLAAFYAQLSAIADERKIPFPDELRK